VNVCTKNRALTDTLRSIKVKDSQALVLDAGHISVKSKLADKDQLKDIQSKRGRQYSDEDFKQLEDLMYDKLSLKLEFTQVSPSSDKTLQS
jgi:vacuolar protein sorting-associated protein 13A/C